MFTIYYNKYVYILGQCIGLKMRDIHQNQKAASQSMVKVKIQMFLENKCNILTQSSYSLGRPNWMITLNSKST